MVKLRPPKAKWQTTKPPWILIWDPLCFAAMIYRGLAWHLDPGSWIPDIVILLGSEPEHILSWSLGHCLEHHEFQNRGHWSFWLSAQIQWQTHSECLIDSGWWSRYPGILGYWRSSRLASFLQYPQSLLLGYRLAVPGIYKDAKNPLSSKQGLYPHWAISHFDCIFWCSKKLTLLFNL